MTPWTVAHQSHLSSTISQNLIKVMSIESVIISNSVILTHSFYFCLQAFSISGSFPVSWLFALGGQNTVVSGSATVLPKNIQGWFPLGLPGLISVQSKGLSRVFSSTTIRKHQFSSAQPPLRSNSYIHTWLLEKNMALTIWTLVQQRDVSAL